jgi:pyroglutamyl-peptidase
MRVLISGFEAFGGRDLNPTALLVDALGNKEIQIPEGLSVEQVLLPVSFEKAFHVLQNKINEINPDVVIAFGQAAKRAAIELETVAINKIDADIKDNLGEQPREQMINHLGEASYLSSLPLQGIETVLKDAGIPVKLSNSAGTYVCNYVFYRLMETNQDTLRLCGFIHVPLLPEQAKDGEASLPFSELLKAVSLILNYIKY